MEVKHALEKVLDFFVDIGRVFDLLLDHNLLIQVRKGRTIVMRAVTDEHEVENDTKAPNVVFVGVMVFMAQDLRRHIQWTSSSDVGERDPSVDIRFNDNSKAKVEDLWALCDFVKCDVFNFEIAWAHVVVVHVFHSTDNVPEVLQCVQGGERALGICDVLDAIFGELLQDDDSTLFPTKSS